jgi:hypothetical protein
MKKTLTILKSLIDPMIVHHFENTFDVMNPETNYEFPFEFKNLGSLYKGLLSFRVEHGEFYIDYINDIQIIDEEGLKYSVGNDEDRQEENQLIISTKSQNPNTMTVQEEITVIIEKQEATLKENGYSPDSLKGGRDYENDKNN